jgi:hypothetical protein
LKRGLPPEVITESEALLTGIASQKAE